MSEMKPCPFCGSKALTNIFLDYEDIEKLPTNVIDDYEPEVTCENERCIYGWWLSPKDWNTRPIEDALNARISELSQAVGLITTLKPTMVMDTEHPLDMAKEVVEYVTVRIAELEAAHRWIPVSERLPKESGWYRVGAINVFYEGYTDEVYFDANKTKLGWHTCIRDQIYCWLDGVPELPLPQPPEERKCS